jgi:LuxR family glucitol operon transcriptional activator
MDRPISAVRNTCFAILAAVESDLREIIGSAALSSGNIDILPDDVRQVASQRYAQDNKQRPDASPENDLDLLEYTDFADLAKMLRRYCRELHDETGYEIEGLAREIDNMVQPRNRVCHSRPLEEDDLPNFLDLAGLLLRNYKKLPWIELKRVQDKQKQDPSYTLRLEIPSFWRVGTERTHHNLPLPDFDETSFLGRVIERREVRKHLLGAHPVISIVGEGGVGKSTLAIQCCYELLDTPDDPKYDAIVWVSLKTKTLTASGIQDIRDSITNTLGVVQTAAEELGNQINVEAGLESVTQELLEYTLCCPVFLHLSWIWLRNLLKTNRSANYNGIYRGFRSGSWSS